MAIVPNLAECQPYFQVYCKAHDLDEGNIWLQHEYIIWISSKHREFKVFKNINRDSPLTDETKRDFISWLTKDIGRDID